MTLPAPRLHPDPAPRMVTHWCRRAEGDGAAPCTCGMCDRPATDPAPDTSGDWSLYAWLPVVLAAAALRWVRIRVGVALIDLGARIMPGVETEAARERGGAT